MKKFRGYTLVEVFICIFGLAALVIVGFLLYAGYHFLSKFW